MTHRRATLAVHVFLVILVLGTAASLVWMTVSDVPDPVDPWMVGPGLIAMPLAVLAAGGAAMVAWGAWDWSRTGRRTSILAGDLGGALGLMFGAMAMPEWFVQVSLATVVVAGGFVAAAKPTGRGAA
jgi:hypothetical protein